MSGSHETAHSLVEGGEGSVVGDGDGYKVGIVHLSMTESASSEGLEDDEVLQ